MAIPLIHRAAFEAAGDVIARPHDELVKSFFGDGAPAAKK